MNTKIIGINLLGPLDNLPAILVKLVVSFAKKQEHFAFYTFIKCISETIRLVHTFYIPLRSP